MTEQRKQLLKRKLQESRYRLNRQSENFFALLKDMLYVATKDVQRISTNGTCIYFDPDWLQKLGPVELDFILAHQFMHIALGHIERPKYYKGDRFHLACDIVANSYLTLLGFRYDKLPHIGKIFYETFFPAVEGHLLTAQKALHYIPFDPAAMKPGVRRTYMIDAETWWDQKRDRGEHGIMILHPGEEDPEDLLCDENTTGGKHFFVRKEYFGQEGATGFEEETQGENRMSSGGEWDKRAADTIMKLRDVSKREGDAAHDEGEGDRAWRGAHTEALDWKKILNRFLQEEVCDYSFTPPDKRMQDSEFFLPDYNVVIENPKNILFMVDTSASIDDVFLSEVYGEIYNALTQFNNGIVGVLAFFDTKVHSPTRFSSTEELLQIKPYGGGGTDLNCIFDYVQNNLAGHVFADIVIFTDGCADFPEESAAKNIPVLWLLLDKNVVPPWGRYAYVEKRARE